MLVSSPDGLAACTCVVVTCVLLKIVTSVLLPETKCRLCMRVQGAPRSKCATVLSAAFSMVVMYSLPLYSS